MTSTSEIEIERVPRFESGDHFNLITIHIMLFSSYETANFHRVYRQSDNQHVMTRRLVQAGDIEQQAVEHARPQLTTLPDEVIQAILSVSPPTTAVSLQQTCRRFASVANEPLLWRQYCQTYRWWDKRHNIKQKFQDASFADWKSLYANRHTSSHATRNAVDRIVAEELGRLDWINIILEAGYDAKEALLDMFRNAASSQNHLAQK